MKVVPAKPGKVRSCAGGTGAAAVCSAPTEVMTESYAWAHRDQEYIAVLALTGRRGDPRRLRREHLPHFDFRFDHLAVQQLDHFPHEAVETARFANGGAFADHRAQIVNDRAGAFVIADDVVENRMAPARLHVVVVGGLGVAEDMQPRRMDQVDVTHQ